jgi:branched-subunit amino acid aminotransferase/4-amino-4-deoxychorismate lyase
MKQIPLLTREDWLREGERFRRPYQSAYYAMYSSLWSGIVTDPLLMMVPADDHVVHRGDGVFEAVKCTGGALYNLQAHLDRLQASSDRLSLAWPWTRAEMIERILATVQAGGHPEAMVRIFVTRGPGGFAVNPYECPSTQMYCVSTALSRPFMENHPGGARVRTSGLPAKAAFMATVKNCNYVPNMLMKKEAVDAGVDFVAGYDENGFLTEGATENIGIVTADRRLIFPRLGGILPGTTMLRVMELARDLVGSDLLRQVETANLTRSDVMAAAELLITGTTVNVTAGVDYDGQPVGAGVPGPVQQALDALLIADMKNNPAVRTVVFT